MKLHKTEKNRTNITRLPQWEYLAFIAAVCLTFIICVSVGTVRLPWSDVIHYLEDMVFGTNHVYAVSSAPQIMTVRVPRVICVALSGMSLALCGCAMQGLLKNPLAEGSTLGVSSGAALGAIIAIAFDISIPFLSLAGATVMAMLWHTVWIIRFPPTRSFCWASSTLCSSPASSCSSPHLRQKRSDRSLSGQWDPFREARTLRR